MLITICFVPILQFITIFYYNFSDSTSAAVNTEPQYSTANPVPPHSDMQSSMSGDKYDSYIDITARSDTSSPAAKTAFHLLPFLLNKKPRKI